MLIAIVFKFYQSIFCQNGISITEDNNLALSIFVCVCTYSKRF